ncbi:MAG TPA: dihydrodipicolinate synthase family protein [Clostridiales bacterium]|nr:dihydrodipicolinate synthase family protein [Clostridiales bacterium]
MRHRLTGIFAPIATPFDDEERIAYAALRRNLEKWARTKLTGLVVLGSNGEFVHLDPSEKERMVAFVREHFPADRPVIAGTGAESTRECIRLTKRAAESGADAALVLHPSYYKSAMTSPVLERYFLDVAEASPIPVMLYNMPRNTGLDLAPELVVRLAAHPNIVGIKDSGGNIAAISEVIAGTPDDFAVFAGSGGFLLVTTLMGGVGGTLAVANILPDECADLFSLARQGRLEQARELQVRLLPVNAAVTSRWGVAGLKAALDMVGFYGGPPRRPLPPLGDEARAELRSVLETAGVRVLRPPARAPGGRPYRPPRPRRT